MRLFLPQENPSRIKLQNFVKEASLSIPGESWVLDAGAGEGMYRFLFEKMRYVSIDLCKISKAYGKISAISDLSRIPFPANFFDMVVCTQVLEHVNDPKAVLFELGRVLKPKGLLWISVPFFYEEHEIPYDFFRYTHFGLRHLLELSNFQIDRMEWLEGYFGTFAYQLNTAARFFKDVKKNYPLAYTIKLLARYCNSVENRSKTINVLPPYLYGKNLIAVAKKCDN